MFLLGEGSEATEPYHKYDKIRPHSIRSLQLDQKVRPLSFRPEKFDLFTATQIFVAQMAGDETSLPQINWVGGNRSKERDRISELVLGSTYQTFE